jgi:hypothetical protein
MFGTGPLDLSELGLAQCEDSFPTTKPKRTVTPVSIVYWKQGVSIIRRKVLEGEKRGLSATRDFGTLYYEDRRPLYCATESHRTVSSGRFLGSPESRSEWSMLGGSCARTETAVQALFSLNVVLNRNTLAPSTIWSTERGR